MSFLDLFRREKRALDDNPYQDGWAVQAPVTAAPATSLGVVLSCVDLIASSVAALPASVYTVDPKGGRIENQEHPVAALIDLGCGGQTWADWLELMLADTLLHGNAASEIVTNERGEVIDLVHIPWKTISIDQTASGRIRYRFTETTLLGAQGETRTLIGDEVFHLRDRGDNRFLGVSRLTRAAHVIEGATMVDQHQKSLWRNLANPSIVLKHEKNLSEGAAMRLKDAWVDRYGGKNNGRPAVLEEGLDVKQLELMSPESAEVMARVRFSVEDVARIFGVPGPMINDMTKGTYSNSEHQIRLFAQTTLAHWINKVEAEFSRAIFGNRNECLDIDMSGLLRGDAATRWKANEISVKNQILTIDEVRQIEGFNPIGSPDLGNGELGGLGRADEDEAVGIA